MRKHAEMFHCSKSYILTTVVSIPTSSFSKYKFVVHVSNVICSKGGLAHPYFSYENESLMNHIWLEKNGNVSSPCGADFPTDLFLRSPFFLGSRVRVRVLFLDDAVINFTINFTAINFTILKKSWMKNHF